MKLAQALCYFSIFSTCRSYLSGAMRSRHAFDGLATRSFSTAAAVSSSQRIGASSMTQLHMATGTAAEATIKSSIDENKIMVFSKSYCPYCLATKKLFSDLGVEFKVMELDQRADGAEIQRTLQEMTGQRTVPNTFISGKHLGGNDKAQAAARSGELQKQLGIK